MASVMVRGWLRGGEERGGEEREGEKREVKKKKRRNIPLDSSIQWCSACSVVDSFVNIFSGVYRGDFWNVYIFRGTGSTISISCVYVCLGLDKEPDDSRCGTGVLRRGAGLMPACRTSNPTIVPAMANSSSRRKTCEARHPALRSLRVGEASACAGRKAVFSSFTSSSVSGGIAELEVWLRDACFLKAGAGSRSFH